MWVSVAGAELASRSESAVLNGANAALVETEAGWELIQFVEAELVDVETYRLTKLLRGQQGSEQAMAAGAEIGSRVLFLTGAEQRLEAADWEGGLSLLWSAWRMAPDEATAWTEEIAHQGSTVGMWSPAHLRAEWDGGDLALGWIRRARKGGDAWGPGEPPHEVTEQYRVSVWSLDGEVRRWDVAPGAAIYDAATQAADFPGGGDALVKVAQLGRDGEPGAVASLAISIPAP